MCEKKVLKGSIGTDMIQSVTSKPNKEIELFRQIQKDEREGEVCPDCMGTGEVMGSSEIGSVTTHQKCFGCKGTGRKK